jgi:hypothetical protein
MKVPEWIVQGDANRGRTGDIKALEKFIGPVVAQSALEHLLYNAFIEGCSSPDLTLMQADMAWRKSDTYKNFLEVTKK